MPQISAEFFYDVKCLLKILLSWPTRLAVKMHPPDAEVLQVSVNMKEFLKLRGITRTA